MDKSYYQRYEPFFNAWYIKRLIGEGSFGQVYEIERNELGVTYKAALKTITIPQSQSEVKSILADGMSHADVTAYYKGVVQDIISEFVLLSKLKGNSHIVSYEDHVLMEHEDGIGWDILIRMELLTPLFEHIEKNRMTKREVIKLGIDLCKALELCQKYNIIHRDVKPENIFLSPIGSYKLGDFGIAKTVEKTSSGLSRKGTYTYMAPEIYRGEAYGSTVDIYSLGIVMYRLLNDNRTPFLPAYPAPITHNDRENALMKRISGATIPKPINAEGRLSEIVRKACSYDSKNRYSSAMQMRMELEAILYEKNEAELIYPSGDQMPIRSIDYVLTEEQEVLEGADKTESILSEYETKDISETEMDEFDKTESVLENPAFEETSIRPEDTDMECQIGEAATEKTGNSRKKRAILGAALGLLILIGGIAFFLFPREVTSITGIDDTAQLYIGDNLSPEYIIEPKRFANETIYFSSSDEKVASIDERGIIKANAVGDAVITLKARNYTREVSVTVKAKVTKISGVDNRIRLQEGSSKTIQPKLSPDKFSDLKVTYKMKDKKIASVDSKGKITAKKAGETELVIRAGGCEKTVKITVYQYVAPTQVTKSTSSYKAPTQAPTTRASTSSNGADDGEEYWE